MNKPVVLFDGECGLCNKAVAWLLRIDRHGVFAITGGQGEAGQQLIKDAGLDPKIAADSIVVVEGNRGWVRSDAVLRILSLLPFPFSLLASARVIPRPLRDAAYKKIAEHRNKIEGADVACGVPPAKLRDRWNERLVSEGPQPQRFEFQIDWPYRLPLAIIFGVRKSRAYVEVDQTRFVARFGHFWVEAPTVDINCVEQSGPYQWWKAIGVRESFVDHGVTFGGTCEGGVCVCFNNKVSGLGPFKRHPGLTMTVKDRDGLVSALDGLINKA